MSGRTMSTEMPRPTATSRPSGASRKLAEKGQLDEPREEVLARVDPRTDLKRAVADADLVVEAAPEKLSARRNLFSTVDEHAPDHVILMSNTSSLSISDIAATTTRSEQVAGAHFFQSAGEYGPVEVVYGDETTDGPAEILHYFLRSTRKTLIYVQKDVLGFIVNTVSSPFIVEPA